MASFAIDPVVDAVALAVITVLEQHPVHHGAEQHLLPCCRSPQAFNKISIIKAIAQECLPRLLVVSQQLLVLLGVYLHP